MPQNVRSVDVFDHNFLRFSAIFGKKLAFFSKTDQIIKFLHILDLFLSQKRQFFAKFFGENIFKIITLVPGHFIESVLKLFRFSKRRLESGRPDEFFKKSPKM
jgi:hypothetical protein